MSSMRYTRATFSAVSFIALVGCLSSTSQVGRFDPLAPIGGEPDAAIIQYVIVERNLGSEDINRRAWDRVDEQVLPYETRMVLEAAGLRVGTASETAPGALRKLIDDPRTAWGHRARTFPLDRPAPLTVSGTLERAEFTAPTAEDARAKFARTGVALGFDMTLRNSADGRAIVKLVPRARYQDPSHILPVDIEDRGLGTDTFPAAAFEIALSPSQYLIVGTDSYWRGTFGYTAFTESSEDRAVQRLLVVRAGRTGDGQTKTQDDAQSPPIAAQAGTTRNMRP
jgi:hypothetical protein